MKVYSNCGLTFYFGLFVTKFHQKQKKNSLMIHFGLVQIILLNWASPTFFPPCIARFMPPSATTIYRTPTEKAAPTRQYHAASQSPTLTH